MRHESGFEVLLSASEEHAAIFDSIDNKRTWREVFAAARAKLPTLADVYDQLLAFFEPTFEQLRQLDWMLLRAAAVGEYPDTIDMQAQSLAR